VAPLEMNAGTCWGKNTIDPGGRSVEKAPGSNFNFNFNVYILAERINVSLSSDKEFVFYYHKNIQNDFGGLGVACWLLVPKFAGEKILSTPSFAACKISLIV
jgi:hypothetical protein